MFGRRWSSLTAVCAVGLLVAAHSTQQTESAWQSGISNTTSRAGTGALSYVHTYAATTCSATGSVTSTSCPSSIAPTVATVASPAVVSATDSINYAGTIPASSVVEQARALSCASVALANRITTANPLLSRYGTTYSTSGGPITGAGFLTLDGANPGGYAASVVQQSQPAPTLSLGTTYGLGIWFKTSSTAGGPIFGFGSSAINVNATNDRVLYMDKTGRVGFALNSANAVTGLSAAGFNNGQWHFAYVTLVQTNVAIVGITSAVTLYLDGTQVATGGGTLIPLSSYAGYWHLGWSPISGRPYGAGLANHFAGSVSNFVVLNTAPAPTNLAVATTQTAFNTSIASSVTEHWLLNDTGTGTFTGTLPVIGATDPCTMVNLSWSLANPTSCVWSPQSTTATCTSPPATDVAAFVTASWQTVSSPGPGGTQTSTVALARAASYNTGFLPGLRLYAPLEFRAVVGPWSTTFSWADAGAALIS